MFMRGVLCTVGGARVYLQKSIGEIIEIHESYDEQWIERASTKQV